MDDQPLDLSKKSTSTTDYQFISVDEQKGSEKEKQITSTRTLSSHEEFSKSTERRRRASEPGNKKLVLSRQRNKENETAVSQDRITGNSVRTKRNITTGSEINSGAKRSRYVKCPLYPDIKDKSIVIDEPDCSDRAASDCISPKPPTSADISCSYDSPSAQGPSTNHNRVLRFICKHCGKGFPYHSTYKRHVQSHTGKKPFVCELCDKRFASSYGLARHNRIHNGERPFTCNYCGKSFADLNRHKIHIRVHTGERPYVCRECNKRFVNSSHLKVHMRIHSGEKPYECEICGRHFSQKGHMKYHKNTH